MVVIGAIEFVTYAADVSALLHGAQEQPHGCSAADLLEARATAPGLVLRLRA